MSRLKQTRAVAELAPWLFMAGDRVVVNKDSALLAHGKFVLPEKLVIPAKAGIQISPSNQAVDFD